MKERMEDNSNVLEPPLKVGSGTPVAESCDTQRACRQSVEDNDGTNTVPKVHQVPTVLIQILNHKNQFTM